MTTVKKKRRKAGQMTGTTEGKKDVTSGKKRYFGKNRKEL